MSFAAAVQSQAHVTELRFATWGRRWIVHTSPGSGAVPNNRDGRKHQQNSPYAQHHDSPLIHILTTSQWR